MKKLVLLVFALNLFGYFCAIHAGGYPEVSYQSERQSGYGLLFAKA